MNLPPLTREQVRRVDQQAIEHYGMSGLVLMENAGRGAADVIHRVSPAGEVAILCGGGNNAGDGYVIARHLELLGRPVRLLSLIDFESLDGDALANYQVARAAEIECQRISSVEQLRQQIASAGTVVECLLGTGASGSPRGLMGEAIEVVNALPLTRIAVDVPAGLDCDTGEPSEPAFRADHTVTFVASKVGFEKKSAASFVGHLHPVGIGVPKKLLAELIKNAQKSA